MFDKIIAFFMAIIAWFTALFSGGATNVNCQTFKGVQYGTQQRQVMDMYLPKNAAGDMGILLCLHGGAWIQGDKSTYNDTAEYVCENYGVAAVTMNYRYINEETDINDILDDITLALNKACEIAAQKGVTLKGLMTMGYSAGAHLAMLYAYSRAGESPVAPKCVFSMAGPTDLTDGGYYQNNALGTPQYVCQLMSYACGQTFTPDTIESAKAALLDASPIKYVDTAVPTIVCHGEKDNTVPYANATQLVAALNDRSIRCDFYSFPDSDHNLYNDNANVNKANDKAVEYINTYLK